MKKAYLAFLPMLMVLAACGPTPTSSNVTSSSQTSSGQSQGSTTSNSSSSSQVEQKLVVYFFVNYDQFDKTEAYDVQKVDWGSKLTKPQNPTCPDEAYPTFLGWSEHPVVDDDRFIIDFDSYTVTKDTKIRELCIYGIWVSK